MKKSMAKIKASLTNNVDLKIVAVLIAAVVWLAVVNISDPEKTIVIYNVPVTVTDENAITDFGMVYTVELGKTVDITISGKRSIVSELSGDDFNATASLEELSKVNSVPINVEAKNKSIGRKITIAKQSLQSMTVSVEDMDTQKFDIEVEFSGKAGNGYVVGDYSLSVTSVDVKAPVSVLDRIERVVAICDISGQESDFSKNAKIILYDKRGDEIKNKNLTLSRKKVGVFVDILKVKEIPIIIGAVGEPADGYRVADVTLSSETVKISGVEDIVSAIENIDITSDIDIRSLTKTRTFTVDLTEKLPEGISISGETTVEVSVEIDKLTTKTFKIKTLNLDVDNLKSGLEMEFTSEAVEITLRGEKSVISDISKEDLKAGIDLKGEDKGTVTVPVSIKVPDNTELLEEVTVKIKLKEKKEN